MEKVDSYLFASY